MKSCWSKDPIFSELYVPRPYQELLNERLQTLEELKVDDIIRWSPGLSSRGSSPHGYGPRRVLLLSFQCSNHCLLGGNYSCSAHEVWLIHPSYLCYTHCGYIRAIIHLTLHLSWPPDAEDLSISFLARSTTRTGDDNIDNGPRWKLHMLSDLGRAQALQIKLNPFILRGKRAMWWHATPCKTT